MKLLIINSHGNELWGAPAWFDERLAKDFGQLEIARLKNYEGVEENLRDAEIAITWVLKPEQFKAAKKLHWIHSPAAAVHQLMFPELVNSDVILTNGREIHGPVVAEHVIAHLCPGQGASLCSTFSGATYLGAGASLEGARASA